MNKNSYRIIYSKARQMFVAVAENVRSQTKTSGQSEASTQNIVNTESQAFHQLWQVKALVASISLWMPLAPVYAGIVADSAANAANRAVIGAGKNSAGTVVPVVNIQTPKNGISHNIYKQFDVLAEGAVLNNSRQGATTKTVGNVAANPFLATGEARVILNEVNSSAASRFEGNLEVAGQMADVIIANPSGINIKGGGFINANKAIFTTGKPQLNADGSIKQFTVDQGKITVSANPNSKFGLGGNNNDANYVDLYARALELSAELRAKNDIQVIAGANNVSADLQDVTAKTGTGTVPTLAVDVKALGGMYANNIYLMGTEKGLGVTNAGTIQAVNNLVITSAGKIEHSGTISSTSKTQGLVNIQTTGTGAVADINSSGSINSNSMLNIDSGNNLNVNAKEIIINNGSLASSPLMINTKGNLNLAANSRIFNDAQSGDVYVDAANINLATNAGITSNRGTASIQVQKDLVAAKGAKLIAAKDLNVLSNGKLSLTENHIQASLGSINLQANSANTQNIIDLQGGTIYAGKDLNLYSSGDLNLKNLGFSLENSATRVKNIKAYSGRNLVWNNADKALPLITGMVQLDAANNLTVTAKEISNKDSIQLHANQIALNSALTSQKNIDVSSEIADLVLSQALKAQGDINLTALAGGVTANSLKATSSAGKISILANKNINLNSTQTSKAMPSADKDELTTDQTVISGLKGVTLGSIGDGTVNLQSVQVNASQGDILVSSNNGINLKANNDVVVTGDTGRFKTVNNVLKGQTVSIENSKSDIKIQNTDLGSTVGKLAINSRAGMSTIIDSVLTSKGNTELYAKDLLTLQGVNATSDQHLAVSSGRTVYSNAEYTPATKWIADKVTNLTSKGVTSVTATGNQVLQNTNLTGGAVLLEAGGFILGQTGLNLNAVGSDLLKNDTKLNSLNGDLTIQTNSNLTIDPKIYSLKAVGDIELVSKTGTLTLKGYGGTAGNGSEQVVKLDTANGGINLEGTKVDIQGSQLIAQKDIKIVSNKDDVLIDGVKNTISDSTKITSFERLIAVKSDKSDLELEHEKMRKDPDYLFLINELDKGRGIKYEGKVDVEKMYALRDALQKRYLVKIDIEEGAGRRGKKVFFIDAYEKYTDKINELDQSINFYNKKFTGNEHLGTSLKSTTGNINIISSKGASISGSIIDAPKGSVSIEASGALAEQYKSTINGGIKQPPKSLNASIIIDGHTDFYEQGTESEGNYSFRTLVSPTIINGDKGVNIRTVGKTKDDNLVLQATGITSKNGDVKIEANKSILFDAAIEQSYDLTTTTEKKKSWGGLKKKYITTVSENNDTNAASVDISAKNISIETKKLDPSVDAKNPDNNIDIYSGRFTAEGGKISINSGGNLSFYTVEESSSSTVDVTKKTSYSKLISLLGSSKTTTNTTRTQISELPATLKADYIGTKSGFDTRLVGTEFEYLKNATIETGGKLELIAAKTSITDLLKKEKSSLAWQSMQDKGSITETAQLPSFNGPVLPTFKAAGGLSVQVPISEKDANKVELRDAILDLSKKPGNEYLKELVNRKDVDWQKVLLTQKDWDYKQQGLTAAGAAIIVIIITIVTMGTGTAAAAGAAGGTAASGTTVGLGASMIGTAGVTTTAAGAIVPSTLGVMANAAVTSLATQASVSLINNGGDIGKTLKDLGSKDSIKNLATSVVTAGVLSQLSNTELMSDLSKMTKQGEFMKEIVGRTTQGIVNAGASSLVSTAINGGSLSENLGNAILANTAMALQASLSGQIKTLESSELDMDYVLHKVAHAAAGCVAASISKSECEAGAIGAAVGEIVAEQMDKSIDSKSFNSDADIQKYQQKVRDVSKLVASSVATLTGYDPTTAASSAEVAILNNRQLYQNEIIKIKMLAAGNANKEARYNIAACALVRCAEGYEGTTEYAYLKAIQDAGNSADFKVERDYLSKQKFRTPIMGSMTTNQKLFEYTSSDRTQDAAVSNFRELNGKYQITTRAGGAVMVVGGGVGLAGSTALGSTCVTGVGCLVALGGFVSSADLVMTGAKQAWSGKSVDTIGAQVISATTGLSTSQAEMIYGMLSMASVTNSIRTTAKQAVQEQRVLINKPTITNCTNGTTCFVAGTLIETKNGLKPIEEFNGNELVWSRNDLTLEYDYKPVIAKKITHNQPIFEVVVQNALGERETFKTTEEHPFWVKNIGWQKASILSEGMTLLDRSNNELTVISQKLLAKLDTVYNIEVKDYHTYHVGKLGVWVHNAQCCDLIYQNIVKETKYGVISNRKLDKNAIDLDLSVVTRGQVKQIAKNGDPLGVKTEALFENVVKEQGGKVLSGGKYGSNNGYDHVIIFKDAQGNTNLTMVVDSKQLGQKGIKLDPKAAGGNMQMSSEWDRAVLAKLDPNSEAYKAVFAARQNGTLVKGAAYVDKSAEKLMLVRIDPATKK
jgi:filamentous hemagglutinin